MWCHPHAPGPNTTTPGTGLVNSGVSRRGAIGAFFLVGFECLWRHYPAVQNAVTPTLWWASSCSRPSEGTKEATVPRGLARKIFMPTPLTWNNFFFSCEKQGEVCIPKCSAYLHFDGHVPSSKNKGTIYGTVYASKTGVRQKHCDSSPCCQRVGIILKAAKNHPPSHSNN